MIMNRPIVTARRYAEIHAQTFTTLMIGAFGAGYGSWWMGVTSRWGPLGDGGSPRGVLGLEQIRRRVSRWRVQACLWERVDLVRDEVGTSWDEVGTSWDEVGTSLDEVAALARAVESGRRVECAAAQLDAALLTGGGDVRHHAADRSANPDPHAGTIRTRVDFQGAVPLAASTYQSSASR